MQSNLYACGDPVNASDPNGREILFGTGAIDRSIVLEVIPAVVKFSRYVVTLYNVIYTTLELALKLAQTGSAAGMSYGRSFWVVL